MGRAPIRAGQIGVNEDVLVPAQVVFDYLSIRSEGLDRADIVLGFGHFDPKIPARCCELYHQGYASRILFTGGIGAGTADLEQPEALYFRDEIRRRCPDIPEDAILVEVESTHTGENVRYSLVRLRESGWAYNRISGLRRVILVANAYRQRRVWLTWRRNAPDVPAFNIPPRTTFEAERALFAEKGLDLIELLVGEVDRIVRYGSLGYIVEVKVPGCVLEACDRLRDLWQRAEVHSE